MITSLYQILVVTGQPQKWSRVGNPLSFQFYEQPKPLVAIFEPFTRRIAKVIVRDQFIARVATLSLGR